MPDINNATFVVERGDVQYKVSGDKLREKLQPQDRMVVEREAQQYKLTIKPLEDVADNFEVLQDDDLFVCQKDLVNYKVYGVDMLEHMNQGSALRLVVPPKIGIDEVNKIAFVEVNSVAQGGTKPYTYNNFWTKINFFKALIDSELTKGLTPLTVLTNGEVYQVGYCQTGIAANTELRCTYSDDGENWNNTLVTEDVICKGARFFNNEFWMVMGANSNNRNLLRSSDGLNWKEIPVPPAGTSTNGKLFNIDYNPSTGTVIVVALNVVARSNIDKLDAYERGELAKENLWQKILVPIDHDNQTQKNYWGYLRACCCDPTTNEWWLGKNTGQIHYSPDDGENWYKTDGCFPSGQSQSYYMEVDNDYLYYTDAESKRSSVHKRDTFERVDDEYYSYKRVDNLDIYRIRKNGLVEAKTFYGKRWLPIFGEPILFNGNGAIVFDARDAESDWVFVSGKEVVVRKSKVFASAGINADNIDATEATSITLKQEITDDAGDMVVGLANIPVDL